MFTTGDRVMYGSHGVCTIVDIEQRRIDRKDIEYYVLCPIKQIDARFYIPVQNPKALSKLSPLLSPMQLEALFREQANAADIWIEDENMRKQKYKEVISSGNRADLIQWVRSLHIRRRMIAEAGKKFHQADDNFLKDAEKLLTTEFSIVLNISEDLVREYVERWLD